MWRSKKVIISVVLAVVLLSGIIGGLALAQEDEDSQPKIGFLERLADKLGITTEELKDKIAEVRAEIQAEFPERNLRDWPARRGHAGCFGNIEEMLGIEINEDALKEALAEAKERIQAGEDKQEVMAEVFEKFGIDIEELKAKCTEVRESHQQMFGDKTDGRFFGPGFGFKGPGGFHRMDGMRSFGGHCVPAE